MTPSLDRAVEVALRDVLERLEAATWGEWKAIEGPLPEQHWETAFCGGGDEDDVRVVCFQQDYCTAAIDDATAIAASVNFLRDYGQQILAALPHLSHGVDRDALRELAKKWVWEILPIATDGFDTGFNYKARHCADELKALIDNKQESSNG